MGAIVERMRSCVVVLCFLAVGAFAGRYPSEEMKMAARIVSTLHAAAGAAPGPTPSLGCILGNCAPKIAKCMLNTSCRKGMTCTKGCGATNQTCIFQCTSDFENDVYDDMIKCFFTDHSCMREPKGQTFSTYEMCRPLNKSTPLTTYMGKPLTADVARTLLTRNNKNYWLVAQGLSKAYDCFECQNLYFNTSTTNSSQLIYTAIYKILKSDGSARWNRADYVADWDTFGEGGPGRMHLHDPDYGGLVHDEDWRIIAVDERTPNQPEWIGLYYCGGAPGVLEAYEGSCVMTPDGLLPKDTKEVTKIHDAYAKIGITLSCTPNNSAAACKGHPTP